MFSSENDRIEGKKWTSVYIVIFKIICGRWWSNVRITYANFRGSVSTATWIVYEVTFGGCYFTLLLVFTFAPWLTVYEWYEMENWGGAASEYHRHRSCFCIKYTSFKTHCLSEMCLNALLFFFLTIIRRVYCFYYFY